MICNCSLAGTDACNHCNNNINVSKTTTDNTIKITNDSAFNDGFGEGHFVGYSFGYEDGRADEQKKIIEIIDSADDHENALYRIIVYLSEEKLKEEV